MNKEFTIEQIESYASAFREGDAIYVDDKWIEVVKISCDDTLNSTDYLRTRLEESNNDINISYSSMYHGVVTGFLTKDKFSYQVITLDKYLLKGGEKLVYLDETNSFFTRGNYLRVFKEDEYLFIIDKNGERFSEFDSYTFGVIPKFRHVEYITDITNNEQFTTDKKETGSETSTEIISNKNYIEKDESAMNMKAFGYETINGVLGMSLMNGSIAYKLGNKWVVLNNDGSLQDVTAFTKELEMDSLVIPTLVNMITKGDLVLINETPMLVLSNEITQVQVVNGDGEVKTIKPTINQMFGGTVMKKIVNPMLNGGMNGMNGMNPMAMMMLMKDNKGSSDMTDMMLMMSMSGGMQNNMGFNNTMNNPMSSPVVAQNMNTGE